MKFSSYVSISVILVALSPSVFAWSMPQEHRTAARRDTIYTYTHDILPMLQANCNPCHFPGGKVYKKLPFDDSVTVARLGRKLNTRLQKPEQQAIINRWTDTGHK